MSLSADFITCPNCKNSVPPAFQACQFCGTSLTNVARPKQGGAAGSKKKLFDYDEHNVDYFGKPKWVWPAYYGIAGYFILYAIVSSLIMLASRKPDDGIDIVLLIVNGIGLVKGLGLIFRIQFIRNVVVFLCSISIIFALVKIPGTLAIAAAMGAKGLLFVITSVIDFMFNCMMIYLIGETE